MEMVPQLCLELLIATILLWVGVFGLCEEALRLVTRADCRVAVYTSIVLIVALFIHSKHGVSSCTLM